MSKKRVLVLAFAMLAACDEGRGASLGSEGPVATAAREGERASSARDERADEAIAEPLAPPTASPRQARMHMRLDAVETTRDAIVAGDLDAATRAADGISFIITTHDMPEAARRHGDLVPERAAAVAAATTIEGASVAFANLVGTCGGCHAAARTTWSWVDTPAPEGDDLEARMARHRWAVERMYEGLLVADAERFDGGAAILEATPLSGEAPPEHETPPGARAYEERLRARARDAASSPDMAARARVYGDLLVACQGCHRLTR